MNFKPELAAKVMAGEKTVTRRLTSENRRSPWCRWFQHITVGKTYAVCPGRGKPAIGRIRVTRVSREPLHLVLNPGEAQREGFADEREFINAWRDINGSWDDMVLVWRVEFEVCDAHAR